MTFEFHSEDLKCPECGDLITMEASYEDGDIIQCDDESCLGALLVEEDGTLTAGTSDDGEEFEYPDEDEDFEEEEDGEDE